MGNITGDKLHAKKKIIIVGFGNMGKALTKGLLRKNLGKNTSQERDESQRTIYICDKIDPPSPEELSDCGIDSTSLHWIRIDDATSAPGKNTSSIDLGALMPLGDTIIVLATKPQNLERVVSDWKPIFEKTLTDESDPLNNKLPLIVSMLAGVPTSAIENLLPPNIPVVRAMPNIAATVDAAATVICAGRNADDAHLKEAKNVFDAVGKTWIAQEEHLDAVTGLSGSGPAYIYMVIEALSDGGVKMGLPRQLSLDLATQTVIGAGILVQETKLHPAVLRDQVTTPGGTTISAIHELERHGLRAMLIQAVVTATRKSALLLQKAQIKNKKTEC